MQIENERSYILNRLKDCVSQLILLLNALKHKPSNISFNEKNEKVLKTCEALEMVLFYGIKVKEFRGVIPFWGLLEKLEMGTPFNMNMRSTVGAVACLPSLKSPIAKSRAWIRQILNNGVADDAMHYLTQQSAILNTFYNSNALLLSKEHTSILLDLIHHIKAVPFNLKVDDNTLNTIPPWVNKMIFEATANPTVTLLPTPKPLNKQPSIQMDGKISNGKRSTDNIPSDINANPSFNNFFQNFESGIAKVMTQVDAAAKFINEQIEATIDSSTEPEHSSQSSSSYSPSSSSSSYNLKRSAYYNPHRSGSTRNITPFFGSHLRDLILDELRCSYAYMNPKLGIPSQAAKMLNFVSNYMATPGLFRLSSPLPTVNEFIQSIEEERPMPTGIDIATVSYVLFQWLNQLPEPLLGYEHHDAILACQALEDVEHKNRNLILLIDQTPWYNKPLLIRTITMLAQSIKPENCAVNKLNVIAVSVMSTSFLLRPKYNSGMASSPSLSTTGMNSDDIDRIQMHATAVGSPLIRYLIENHIILFQHIRDDLGKWQNLLREKNIRIRKLIEKLACKVNLSDIKSDGDLQQLIRKLHNLLFKTEKMLLYNRQPDSDFLFELSDQGKLAMEAEDRLSMDEILCSIRWSRCGFIQQNDLKHQLHPPSPDANVSMDKMRSSSPLADFTVPKGYMALEVLVGFLDTYHDKGSTIAVDFALSRKKFCTLPQVTQRLTHFTADVLQVFVNPSPTDAPLQYLAKQPSWAVLNEEKCFQEVFDMAMLSFDDAWRNCTERISELPTIETYSKALFKCRSTLWVVLAKRPNSINNMWEHWMSLRLLDQERLINKKLRESTASLHHVRYPPPRYHSQDAFTHDTIVSTPSEATNPNVIKPPADHLVNNKESSLSLDALLFDSDIQLNSEEISDHVKPPDSVSPSENGSDLVTLRTVSSELSVFNYFSIDGKFPVPPSVDISMVTLHEGIPFVDKTAKQLTGGDDLVEALEEKNDFLDTAMVDSLYMKAGDEVTKSKAVPIYPYRKGGSWDGFVAQSKDNKKILKITSEVKSYVLGECQILSEKQINQLESALPVHYQCMDWKLNYRLSIDGANLDTLLNRCKNISPVMLVIRDRKGIVFGALITDAMKILTEKENKYYGNGNICVWSFASGVIQLYPWSYKNSYFLLTSKDAIALGGGGNFAIYLDSDLRYGCSGFSQTFDSPCLASSEEFECELCETFALLPSTISNDEN